MKLGDRGSDVMELQQFLIGAGFLAPIIVRDEVIPPEANYGVKTKKAVIDLQNLLGIEPTGIWDDSIYNIYLYKISPSMLYRSVDREESNDSDPGSSTPPSNPSDPGSSTPPSNPSDPGSSTPQNNPKSKDGPSETQTPTFKSEDCPKGRWFDQDKEIECYIINRLTGTKIIFGISPEEITESVSAQFDEADVRGRSSPFKQYSQSGPKSVSFTISLYADYCPMGIAQTVSAIKALVYPQYSDVIEAPHSYFKLGKFIAIDGIVSSVSVTWKKPFRDGYYLFADVSIDMDEVRSVAQSAKEVESSG